MTTIDRDDLARAIAAVVERSLASTTPLTATTTLTALTNDETCDGIACAIDRVRESAIAIVDVGLRAIRDACHDGVVRRAIEANANASEANARAMNRAMETIEEQKHEIARLRERLGRAIVCAKKDEDDDWGGDDWASASAERAFREKELWRDACGKYRKRAEHYEGLYKALRARERGDGAHAQTPLPRAETSGLGKRAPPGASEEREGGDDFKRATRGGASASARVEEKSTIGGLTLDCAPNEGLWGSTQRPRREASDAKRRGDAENANALRDDGELGRRGHAPALDRIFLDFKNSSADPTEGNRVRKNKRLTDNAPKPANEVFEATTTKEAPKGVKYVEVVRKKDEREKLDAYVCEECRTFYNAMMPEKKPATIKCTHEPPANAQNSRHRAKWAPEPAPKGFWNLAFTPPETAEAEGA